MRNVSRCAGRSADVTAVGARLQQRSPQSRATDANRTTCLFPASEASVFQKNGVIPMTRHDEWLASLRTRLDAWSAGIDRLALQVRHADAGSRAALAAELELLQRMRDDAERRLQSLSRSDAEPPPVLRARSTGAWRRRHTAFARLHG